jgi:hypothetical protein
MKIELGLDATSGIVAIQQLKARYADAADAKYGPGYGRADAHSVASAARRQAECFTQNARWIGGAGFGGDISGRSALVAFFADPPWKFATHLYGSPIITVDGERAHGSWRLWQLGVPSDDPAPVLMISRTEEHYVHTPEGWLHDYVRFTRIDKVSGADVLSLEAVL